MSRFYVPKENIKKDHIEITGGEVHHILDVLRLREKDKITVFDGTGNEYVGFIKKVDRKSEHILVEIVQTKTPLPENIPDITLVQAIPKKSKMEYIVEKAVELGVSKITPVVTARTVVRPDPTSVRRKSERWSKIAIEASKQCGRPSVPVLGEIENFENVIDQVDQYDLALLACLHNKTVPMKNALAGFKSGKVIIFVGPEGDFTPDEIELALNNNCKLISLGGRTLKSDTAGLFILSVLGYLFTP